ncbi:MAG: phage holin family protein [Dehalococcoidia bacterium]|nr:phage holin family protein [Dehalococcoidia bacterium]
MTNAAEQPGLGDLFRRGRDEARQIGEEFAGIAEDMRQLARSEVELAKAEVREQIQIVTRAAIYGAIAAVVALIALGLAFITLRDVLDLWMPTWAASLISTGVALLVAAIVGWLAYSRFKRVSMVPKKTMSSVKEDVLWAKDQLRSSATLSTSGTR